MILPPYHTPTFQFPEIKIFLCKSDHKADIQKRMILALILLTPYLIM